MVDADVEQPGAVPGSGEAAAAPKRKTLSITIRDRPVLYAAYMPFLKCGGLFIPTKKYFAMGDEMTLVITLLEEPTKYTVNCKVVWITPPDSQSNKAGGIGVQFADDMAGEALRKRIEEILGILLQSNDATHTM
jgi:type IV pilus assembly protein PilZ